MSITAANPAGNLNTIKACLFIGVFTIAALTSARATVAVSPLYGNNMVIQRDQPFPVRGTAAPNKTITVSYNSQTTNTTSDALGNWQVALPAMSVKANGSNFIISEVGVNTNTLSNVVVGDVWLFSGQSNMGIDMNYCKQPADVSSANFPGIRCFGFVPTASLGAPSTSFGGSVSWSVCSSSTAGGYSAVAFYFGRTIYTNQNSAVPIGLVVSCVGGTKIDPWLGPEGLTDIPVLAPLYTQDILPSGPFSLFNGMIYPLAPLPVKGVLWYQGENAEATVQSADSYYLKEKGLINGWKRLLASTDCAFYLVQIANSGTQPSSAAPVLSSGGWDADTRLQQGNAINLPHAGVASAIDIGDSSSWSVNAWLGWHPTNKWDVGGRLALWALKNEYGQTNLVASGPVLRDVTVSGSTAVCTFDYAGSGLMAGYKPVYGTAYPTNSPLALFSIAGAGGTWYWATATITGSNTVTLSSPSVTTPKMVSYACWQNPLGANLYNSNGLPALPFYVANITNKYTVTASAGTGGSISPSGATTYLTRMTALYTITPDAGNYIQDVKVDGVSVGAVKYYTFDPLYTNHTIAATFTNTLPGYTVTATAGPGGSVAPTGAVSVAQGASQSFSITPNSGNLVTVTADGKPMQPRSTFAFPDVRTPHTLSAAFFCTINAQAGYGGAINPSGTTTIGYGSNQTFTVAPSSGFAIVRVTVDGTNLGALTSYTFTNVTGQHTIIASFAGPGGSGSVPQTNQIIFSCLTDTLPASGSISSWSTYIPSGQSLATIGTPTAETIDSRKFDKNLAIDGDGFRFGGSYSSSIVCTGASIVVVAKPTRYGADNNWQSLVDVFYDRLVLGIMNGSGRICVRRNGSSDYSSGVIPEGQTVILSLVVQSNGTYRVYTNGVQAMSIATTSDMTALVPGVTGGAGGYGTYINVGRNNPDAWTTFNGNIGDVFLYKTALSDTDRVNLETYLATRLVGTNYTISASAGAGGTIAPSGAVLVAAGTNQTFTITPSTGYNISNVTVDSVSKGAISSYTFTNVLANHVISAAFSLITNTITASAGTGGAISPSGSVPVAYGSNQTFTITANTGYNTTSVTVDGVSKGAISSYTFTNVTVAHTISAAFSLITNTITAAAGTGGSITPSGGVLVAYGSNQGFTIAALTGYAISNVMVDGVPKGAVSIWTFTNVTAPHAIQASFVARPSFSSVSVSGSDLILVSTGVTNGQSLLWSSTNATAPFALWSAVKTNNVGADGWCTNRVTMNPAEARRFYMLSRP